VFFREDELVDYQTVDEQWIYARSGEELI